MPPLVTDLIEQLRLQIRKMRRGGSKDHPSPHKLILLLTVFDLIEQGHIVRNQIYLDGKLISAFERNFGLYARPDDWCQVGPPFFHLRTSGFWHHRPKQGREAVYEVLDRSGGGIATVMENIEYAYFSDEVFGLVSDPNSRSELRSCVISLLDETGPGRNATTAST